MATFLLQTVLISLSGVMAPGPITAITVGQGNKSPHAGALVAIGHGVVEFPLMIAMFYGLGPLMGLSYIKVALSCVGGLLLLIMGVGMLRNIKQAEVHPERHARPPVIAGILLSLGNPYFFIWWATVGAALISRAVDFGPPGFLAFAPLHWLCDFAWLYALSVLSFTGGKFFGKPFQKAVFGVCGAFLLFLGAKFFINGVTGFWNPPTI